MKAKQNKQTKTDKINTSKQIQKQTNIQAK